MTLYRSLALAVLMALACSGQQPTSFTKIVGKAHPELIDDATAYLHFFRSLSRSDGEPQDQFNRRRLAFAKKTGLPPDQIPRLLFAADSLTEQMAAINTQQVAGSAEGIAAHTNAVMSTVQALQKAIGPGPSVALAAYVNAFIKPAIVKLVPKSPTP